MEVTVRHVCFEPEAADHLQTLVHVSLVSSLPPPLRRGTQCCNCCLVDRIVRHGAWDRKRFSIGGGFPLDLGAMRHFRQGQGLAVMQALYRDVMAAVVPSGKVSLSNSAVNPDYLHN